MDKNYFMPSESHILQLSGTIVFSVHSAIKWTQIAGILVCSLQENLASEIFLEWTGYNFSEVHLFEHAIYSWAGQQCSCLQCFSAQEYLARAYS